ncbi:nucleoside 2-deoxyribosyltransferase [Lacticaseibacillus brantae]|uniref:Nucleoside 2-deoxyribosyltransferase n=1 Tax=Lacticaseibacillus brantae DSM 23927 TaxID=1423727 RepID=A0A0R2B769_9LACO|nr:nucleoside 2-deoxyribosyltransferase [Lacticaseibacillus brantae]KRM71491.1 Nucleoside 2-deoxyribosyltransferase [Lacticaseibacillus brantae DSM 23927]
MKVYLAGPFFSQVQLDLLAQVHQALQQNATIERIFSPKDETNQAGLVENSPEWQTLVFKEDIGFIDQADVVVAILDYDHSQTDPGTAMEIGYAFGKQMPVVAVAVNGPQINLMLAGATKFFTTTVNDLAKLDFNAIPDQPYVGDVF